MVDPNPGPSGGPQYGLNDSFRVAYHRDYLAAVKRAMVEDGADVRGYFVWSLLDNVEWGDGLLDRFGLFQVVRPSLERVAKASVAWLTQFIQEWQQSDGSE